MHARRWLPTLLLGSFVLLLSAGCEDESWWHVPDDLVTSDSVSVNGKVYLLSPYGNRVIQVDRVTREVLSVEVGRNPRVLTTDQGVEAPEHIYTINQDDHTLSVIDIAAFEASPEDYVPDELQLRPFFDQLIFSPSGDVVVSFIGGDVNEEDLVGQGSVNPNEIAIIDLAAEPRTVEFRTLDARPTDVVFTDDGSKAVIPMRTDLAVLYMATLDVVRYPFSLDSADPAQPALVRTSPDSSRAFASVAGETDVYIIDMDTGIFETIIATPFVPRDIQVTPDGERTIVAGGSTSVVVFDNVIFEPENLDVGTGVDTLVLDDDTEVPFALMYNASYQQSSFATVEFDDGAPEIETYVTDAPISRIEIDPTGQTAVIFHTNSGYGTGKLSMFNLEQRHPSTILLESAPHDLTFLPSEEEAIEPIGYVMVILKDSNTLVRYSLSTYEAVIIGVAENPDAVGMVHALDNAADRSFAYVVHDEPLGLLTFLNPYRPLAMPAGFPTVYGYGLVGLLD